MNRCNGGTDPFLEINMSPSSLSSNNCLNICKLAIVTHYDGGNIASNHSPTLAQFTYEWGEEVPPVYLCPLIGDINTATAPGKMGLRSFIQ